MDKRANSTSPRRGESTILVTWLVSKTRQKIFSELKEGPVAGADVLEERFGD